MTPDDRRKPEDKVHGHTGPTTPAEDRARDDPAVPQEEKARIAEEASREEDA
jgi:hypothetical protein